MFIGAVWPTSALRTSLFDDCESFATKSAEIRYLGATLGVCMEVAS
jgi:hypothetical protein